MWGSDPVPWARYAGLLRLANHFPRGTGPWAILSSKHEVLDDG